MGVYLLDLAMKKHKNNRLRSGNNFLSDLHTISSGRKTKEIGKYLEKLSLSQKLQY